MITAFFAYSIPFFALGIIVFFLTTKVGFTLRILVSLAIWIIPSLIFTIWVSKLEDNMPPGATIITPIPEKQEK